MSKQLGILWLERFDVGILDNILLLIKTSIYKWTMEYDYLTWLELLKMLGMLPVSTCKKSLYAHFSIQITFIFFILFYYFFKTWVSKIIFLCSTDITFLMQYSYTFKKLGVLKLLLDPTWSIADLGSYWLAVLSDISEWFIFIYNKM